MSGEEAGEETYSLIFRSLKHPIRRKTLRMLANRPMSFSEMLEGVTIDSGHMTYHLESLGELITRTPDGKYALSGIGMAAMKLMRGVEERVEEKRPLVMTPIKKQVGLGFVSVILLASALTPPSLFACGYTISTIVWERIWYLQFPLNQTFTHNLTVLYEKFTWEYKSDGNSTCFKLPNPVGMTTVWEEDYAIFRIDLPPGYVRLPDNMEVWLSNVTIVIVGINVLRTSNFFLKNLETGELVAYMVPQRISGSSARLVYDPKQAQAGSTTLKFDTLLSEGQSVILGLAVFGEKQQHSSTLTFGLRRVSVTKPFYYLGIAGLLIALICPTVMLVSRVLAKRKP